MPKIFIVEDDPEIRTELELFLGNSGFLTASLEDFTAPVDEILAAGPDLVLLDIQLPGISGLHICDGLRRKSNVPIIFVTGRDTALDELDGMLRGADDYIAKPFQMPVLLAHIQAVLRRTMPKETASPAILEHSGLILEPASAKIRKDGQEAELTKSELKILYYLFLHKGEIVSRMDLIDHLWENDVFIDDNTLSVHVTRLRGKLAGIGAADFIQTRRGLGYQI